MNKNLITKLLGSVVLACYE